MSKTFKIFFTNSSGFDNNFAFFSDVPKVDMNGGSPNVYSNVVASHRVKSDNGDTTWEIDVTQTYYGFCSKSPVPVASLPGQDIVTSISNSKLATLGSTGSPGSTFWMVDDAGSPTFDSTTFEAPDGSFQINAKSDAFKPDENFVCGLGSVDSQGVRIPVATFAAQPNSVATITPVVKFYISMFSATTGTVIDVTQHSLNAASIDFTHKSANAAFVNQVAGGTYNVRFGTSAAMHTASRILRGPKNDDNFARYQELARLVKQIQHVLEDPADPMQIPLYSCKAQWANGPTSQQKATTISNLTTYMNNHGYNNIPTVPGAGDNPPLWGISSANTIDTVRADWTKAVNSEHYVNTPVVINGGLRKEEQNGRHDVYSNGNTNDLEQLAKVVKKLGGLAAY